MKAMFFALMLASLVLAACDADSPTEPSVFTRDFRADHCVDAGDGRFSFSDPDRRGDYLAGYFQPFTNTCSYAIDLHSVACITVDGGPYAGNPNEWMYVGPGATEEQYYRMGTHDRQRRFRIRINYNACEWGTNRSDCGRAEVLCPGDP